MYEPKTGDAVIVTHPMFDDRHLVAQIAKTTAKMVGLYHLDRYGRLVTSHVQTRANNAVVGKLRDGIAMDDAQKELNAQYEALHAAEKAAKEAYRAGVKTLVGDA